MPRGTLYLLDTNVLIAYLRGGQLGHWIESNYQLLQTVDRPVISVVSQGEVYSLARQFNWGAGRYDQIRALLRQVVILDINVGQIIEAYADIDHYTRSSGRSMGKNDVWIAATARAYGTPILTTDRDFDHLDPQWVRREWIDETVVRRDE